MTIHRRSVLKAMAALPAVGLAAPAFAQSSYTSQPGPGVPPYARTVSLAGPRFGLTMLNERIVEKLKERGIWVVGADMGGKPAYSIDMTGPVALVVGGEDRGVRRLVLEKCDHVAGLPMQGKLNSLNASVAAGVLMYEVVRQRLGKGV